MRLFHARRRASTLLLTTFIASCGPADFEPFEDEFDAYAQGTQALKPQAANPARFLEAGNPFFFVATDSNNRRELWKSDGTKSGTVLVKEMVPGIGTSLPVTLTDVDGTLYFTANDGTTGIDVWTGDGTDAGAVVVSDFPPGTDGLVTSLLPGGNAFVFPAFLPGSGVDSWRADGSEAETRLVHDIFGSHVFFVAEDADVGRVLVVVDSAAIALSSGLACPNVVAEATGPDGALVSFAPYVIDNPSVVVTTSPVSGSRFPLGDTTVTASTDTMSCTFVVTVRDTTAPTVTCPPDVTKEAANASGAVVTYGAGSASDAVSGPLTVSFDKASGGTFALGETRVTGTAKDAAGNVARCSFQVTVADTTKPVITCPDAVVAEATSPSGAQVLFPVATATDAVTTSPAITYNHPRGGRFGFGATTVTATAVDLATNSASCTFRVTVQDTTKPVITCPTRLVVEAQASSGAVVSDFQVSATDVASSVTLSYNKPQGSAFALGETTVTARADDARGNFSTCSFKVAVVDTTQPVITCSSDVEVEAAGGSGAVVSYPPAIATDAVSRPRVTYSKASGSVFALGTTTVTATATDDAGNADACSFTVQVVDRTKPVITCPANQVLEATSPSGAIFTSPQATATDTVGVKSVIHVPALGSTFAFEDTRVTATATDTSGNVAQCSFLVTVVDTIKPSIACPPDQVVEADGASGTAFNYPPAIATDAGSTPWLTYTHDRGFRFALGLTTVTATATDTRGNASSCSFKVQVVDTTKPVITCPGNVRAEATSSVGAPVTYPAAHATDTVLLSTVGYSKRSGDTFVHGDTTVTATATDSAGNFSECSFTVTVEDTVPPVISCPQDIAVEATNAAGIALIYREATATDTGSALPVSHAPESGSTFPVGTTTVTATARDPAGHVVSCSFLVTVIATTRATIACPDDVIAEATSASGAAVSYPPARTTGIDETQSIAYSKQTGSAFRFGETIVTAEASGAAGLVLSCSFTVTVVDTTPPTIVCSRDVIVETDDASGRYVSYADAVAEDAVSTPRVTYDHPAQDRFAVGRTPVTATATDAAGNTSECRFAVTVILKSDPTKDGDGGDEDVDDEERDEFHGSLVGGCDCSGASAPTGVLLLGLASMLGRRRRGR